ncbi:MAG: bifunctional heptose 7-phosphate kinase/heptose 1-phosphate adenyltransferase [Anaerolineae bacterium]|jgi:rfaE bifunctional protein kinase chain/domain|nr:carbohydrate kinase [Chloroflexota bacterium]
MDEKRLGEILERFPSLRLLVVGDYFLDRYLIIDPGLAELSLETGRTAHQVVDIRNSPGAAGTVANNLRALEVGVVALGIVGRDGMGFELKRALQRIGVDVAAMIESDQRVTPTYTKPMERLADGSERETERQDIKNRMPTPTDLEGRLIEALRQLAGQVDGIIVADQVPESDCGAITAPMRQALAQLAQASPEKPIAVDSRRHIGRFDALLLKPNEREAWEAVHGLPPEGTPALDESAACGRALARRTGRPVFVTVGDRGILVVDGGQVTHVPAPAATGPIDIVGAGDSAMSAIVASLCADATPVEAAAVANLVASITIQQLGTTGTASRAQVLARHRETSQ